MKAYKVEILIIDFDGVGEEGIKYELGNANFPNDCITLSVKNIVGKNIGEWSDDHPLNKRDTCETEYKKLFSE